MKIVEKIGIYHGDMTKTEKKISNYIMENTLEFTLQSIGDVAKELEVSKTSLIRFGKKIGFESYTDFKKKIQEEEIIQSTPGERYKKLVDSNYICNAEKIQLKEIDNISQSLLNIDESVLRKFINMVSEAKKIYTIGWGVSAFLSQIFSYRMKSFGFPFEALSMTNSNLSFQLMYAQKEEILIVFEFPDYSTCIFEAVKYAKSKGLYIVLITDYATCPISKYADLIFYSDSQTYFLKNSLIGPMFLINFFISQIAYQNNDRIIYSLDERENIRKTTMDY